MIQRLIERNQLTTIDLMMVFVWHHQCLPEPLRIDGHPRTSMRGLGWTILWAESIYLRSARIVEWCPEDVGRRLLNCLENRRIGPFCPDSEGNRER